MWISLRRGGGKGIPIGNLTSQLFANVYLNELDHFVKEKLQVHYYLRYTDDFVMLHDRPLELVSLLPLIREFLHERLGLELHPKKIELRKLRQGIDFLGYITLPHYRALRTKTKRRIFSKVGKRIREYNTGLCDDFSFNQIVQSYLGMLGHGNGYGLGQRLRNGIWVSMKMVIDNQHRT